MVLLPFSNSVAGVEPQTETVWRQADKYGVPRMGFINKMDRIGADFAGCVAMMKDRLGVTPLVLQLPIGSEASFAGVVDLVTMRATVWKTETLGAEFHHTEIPEDLKDAAVRARQALLDTVLDLDEAATAAYLENGTEPTPETLRACIRKGTIAGSFVPVLCGSAFRNKGIQPMLDAVVDYLPAPVDIGAIKGHRVGGGESDERAANDDAPFAGLAFKVMNDPYVGPLTFFRVYSGTVSVGDTVFNPVKGEREKIGRMLLMHANSREDIERAHTGDIVAFAGLEHTNTGDTLCDPAKPIVLERMDVPEPVIEVVVEPKTDADHDRMSAALSRLMQEESVAPDRGRSRERADDHPGHGRAAFGDRRRSDEARVPRRCGSGRPQGGLPRDDHSQGRDRPHPPQADRRPRPVRARGPDLRAAGGGGGLRVREPGGGGCGAQGVRRRGAEGA